MSFNKILIQDENEILNYTYQDLKPLFDLIPQIKLTEDFSSSKLVTDFQKQVYKSKFMVDFNWLDWEKGNVIAEEPKFDYSKLDTIGICKLITAVV